MPQKKPNNQRKPLFRTFAATERLAPSERKRIFAHNFDQLIRIVGLKRNEAAEQIGIPYPLIRRLASAGVSRLDARNEENILKIVEFFVLRDHYELWQPTLLSWLLNPEYDTRFFDRFRDNLARVLYQKTPNAQKIDQLSRTLISGILGSEPSSTGYWAKVEAIMASPKAEQFERLIDDYHELISDERKAAA